MAQPQQSVDHHREPCPDRILDDVGGAFAMGAIGGGLYHAGKHVIWGPKNFKTRGAIEALRREAPRMGGSFAVWGGLFSGFDCTLVYMRQKEDPWNSIASAALTGGCLSARMGPNAAMRSAFFGGMILAAIEGMGMMLQKNMAPPPSGMPAMNMPEPAPRPPSEVLVGGSGGPPGGMPHSSDPNVLLSSEGALVQQPSEPEGTKASGWFPSGIFS